MHLGEKGITGKNSLWERATRVPLIFAGPGVTAGSRVSSPAELIDIHPTLIELADLEVREDLDGESLVPQLRDPLAPRERPALTTSNPGNHSVRSERYRYIRYADGSEEFYDHLADSNEWRNLAEEPQYAQLLAWHRRWLPAVDHPHLPGRSGRILEYDSVSGRLIWEGKIIPAGSTPPDE
jgi:arylsulfatase A-like enzyme